MAEATMRGIDHIGITVQDIEVATNFLVDGLGAEVIYESIGHADPPLEGKNLENHTNCFPGTRVTALRMIRVGYGPDIELFEMHADEQSPSARGSDFGLQHMAVYTDDPEEAVKRFERAGGKMNMSPIPIPVALETAPHNTYAYGQAPWGMLVEFMSRPDHMKYEEITSLRRWHDEDHK